MIIRVHALCLIASMVKTLCAAEFPMLQIRDAMALIERTPAFEDAVKKGYCPYQYVLEVNDRAIGIALHPACAVHSAPTRIGGFRIDRYTGVVQDFLTEQPLYTAELKTFRKELFADNLQRRISVAQAQCLASRLEQDAHGCAKRSGLVPIADLNAIRITMAPCGGTARYRQLRVDRYNGIVTEIPSEDPVDSPALIELRRLLLNARRAPELTEADAVTLAVAAVSELLPGLRNPSACVSEISQHSQETLFSVVEKCGAGTNTPAIPVIAVNRFDATVRDGRTRAVIAGPRLAEHQQRLLEQSRKEHELARSRANAICGGSTEPRRDGKK